MNLVHASLDVPDTSDIRIKYTPYNDIRHLFLKGNIMPNKLVTALKENKNDVRKKVIIATAVTVGVIATAVVLSKMKDQTENVLLITTEAGEAIADATIE